MDGSTPDTTPPFDARRCIGHGGLASFDIDGCTSTTMTWGDTKCICIISCGCADGFLPLSDAKMKVFCPPPEDTERSWADLIRSSWEEWYEFATGGPEFNLVNCIRWSGDEFVGACGGTGEKTDEGTPPSGGCVRLGDGAFSQGSPACPIGTNACVVTYTDGSYDITGCPCDPDDAESC